MANIYGPRHVFICRLGHASYEATGSPGYYRCKKIVRTVDEKSKIITWHPCRKKTLILEKAFAANLYKRGYRKAQDRDAMFSRRWFDLLLIKLRDFDAAEA